MNDSKHISGLRLLNATRLALTNHDTSIPTIAVNGRKLSHADIDLGTLLISGETVKTKDALDGNYYQVLNSNSKIDVKFDDKIEAGKVQ
jgi:negative regulator of replication initiation